MVFIEKRLILVVILGLLLIIGLNQIIYCEEADYKNTRIAFNSYLDGDSDIYIINPDGTGLLNITDDEYNNFLPSWSPDGRKIVYTSRPEDDIYIIDINGKNKRNLTNSSNYASFPDWSPDGEKIIYMSETNTNKQEYNIFVINTDGSNLIQLTDNSCVNTYPKWSPDGNKIAFISNRNGSFDLFTMDVNGRNVKYLATLTNIQTLDIIEALSLSWSPDGSKIAFTAESQGNFDIFTINVDGTGMTNITETISNNEALPDWSADSSVIAFISIDDNNILQLYIMNKDGSGKKQITDYQFNNSNPEWSPLLENNF